MDKPLQTLHKALREQNYDVPESYDDFEYTLSLPGDAGYKNRHALWQSLKDDNFDVPDNYEDFRDTLFNSKETKQQPTVKATNGYIFSAAGLDSLEQGYKPEYVAAKQEQQPVVPTPSEFGQLNMERANKMSLGLGPTSWEEEDDFRGIDKSVADKTQRILSGNGTPAEQKMIQQRLRQRMDEMTYKAETGKRLRQQALNPDFEAPTLARDKDGNVLRDEQGRPLTGFTTEQDIVDTHRQIIDEQAQWDKLSDKEKHDRIEQMKQESYQNKYDEPTILESFTKGLGSGIIRTGMGIIDVLQQLSSGMIVEDPSSPTGYRKVDDYNKQAFDSNNAITRGVNTAHDTAESLSRQAQPYQGKGFLDMLWDGQIGGVIQKGLATAAESLPMTLSAFNPYTMVLNGISLAGQNFREQTLENPDIATWKRLSMAVGSAAIEQAVEKYADPVFKYIGGRKILSGFAKESSEELSKQITKEATENLAKRIYSRLGGILKDAAGEGVEEIATNVGTDILGETLDILDGDKNYGLRAQWDKLLKENPNANMWDFAQQKAKENVEAFMGGAFAGAYTSGTTQASVRGLQYVFGGQVSEDDIINNPDRRIDPETISIAQSFDEGFAANQQEEKEQMVIEADAAKNNLARYGQDFVELITKSENPTETLGYLSENGDLYTAEHVAAAEDYFQKIAKVAGIEYAENNEEEKRVDRRQAAYDRGMSVVEDNSQLPSMRYDSKVAEARMVEQMPDGSGVEAIRQQVIQAVESGDIEGAEAILQRQSPYLNEQQREAIDSYIDSHVASQGVADAIQQQTEDYEQRRRDQIQQTADPQGMVTPLQLKDGSIVYYQSGDMNGYHSNVFVTTADGEVKQISSNDIVSVDGSYPVEDILSRDVQGFANGLVNYYQMLQDGSMLKPEQVVDIVMGNQLFRVTSLGQDEQGNNIIQMEDGSRMALTPEDTRVAVEAADDYKIQQMLGEEREAAQVAQRTERFNNGIVGYREGTPRLDAQDTKPEAAAEYLVSQTDGSPAARKQLLQQMQNDIEQLVDGQEQMAQTIQQSRNNMVMAEEGDEQYRQAEAVIQQLEPQLEDMKARQRKWGEIRQAMMNDEERQAFEKPRIKAIGQAKTQSKKDYEAAQVAQRTEPVPSGKELLEQYDERSDAEAFVEEHRKQLNQQYREEVYPAYDNIQKTLNDYQHGLIELSSDDIKTLTDQQAALEAQMNSLVEQQNTWKKLSNSLGRLYASRERESMDPHELVMSDISKEGDKSRKLKLAQQAFKDDADALTALDDMEPHDVYEWVAENLGKGSINWEGKQVGEHHVRGLQEDMGKDKRRGIGAGYDTNGYNYFLAPEGQGGGIDEVIHSIAEGSPYSTEDVRNALLGMLADAQKPTDITNRIIDDRIAQAEQIYQENLERERQADIDFEDDAIRQTTGLEPEEYEAMIADLEQRLALQEGFENSDDYFKYVEEYEQRRTERRAGGSQAQGAMGQQGQEGEQAELTQTVARRADAADGGIITNDVNETAYDAEKDVSLQQANEELKAAIDESASEIELCPHMSVNTEADLQVLKDAGVGDEYLDRIRADIADKNTVGRFVPELGITLFYAGKMNRLGMSPLAKKANIYHENVHALSRRGYSKDDFAETARLLNEEFVMDDVLELHKDQSKEVQNEEVVSYFIEGIVNGGPIESFLAGTFSEASPELNKRINEISKLLRNEGRQNEQVHSGLELEGTAEAQTQQEPGAGATARRTDGQEQLEGNQKTAVHSAEQTTEGGRVKSSIQDLADIVEFEGNPNYSEEEQKSLRYVEGESFDDYAKRNNSNVFQADMAKLYLQQKYGERLGEIADVIGNLTADNAIEAGRKIGMMVDDRAEGYGMLYLLKRIPVEAVLPFNDGVSEAFTSFPLRLQRAKDETNVNPTEEQKKAGNYKMGHISFGGYKMSIENPKGSTRRGVDVNGKPWSIEMQDTYGYIGKKYGTDGDHLDFFINDDADLDTWNGRVFVVDQKNEDGTFDEHKVMYGYPTWSAARKAYERNYEPGWWDKHVMQMTGVRKQNFDKWLNDSDHKHKPFAEYYRTQHSETVSSPVEQLMADVEERKSMAEAQPQHTEPSFKAGELENRSVDELKQLKKKAQKVKSTSKVLLGTTNIQKGGLKERTLTQNIAQAEADIAAIDKVLEQKQAEQKQRIEQQEIGGAMVDQLEGMGFDVTTNPTEMRRVRKQAEQDKSEEGKLRHFRTPDGDIYGFSYKGKIYLDIRKIDAELPIHEYAHPWCEAFRRLNPEGWKSIVDLMKGDKDTWEFIKQLNPDLTDENDIAEEMITKCSGQRGAEYARKEYERMNSRDPEYKSKWGNIWKNISKAIQDFWKQVGDFLHIKYQSAEQVYDQVVRDFANKMNPRKRVEDWLKERDDAYMEAVNKGDIDNAKAIFDEALRENIGNGITPYIAVEGYRKMRTLAHGVKSRDPKVIAKVADLMAPLIPKNAVLVPAPSHSGKATDMLDLANAISERTGAPVADVLTSKERGSQYEAKYAGAPIASKDMGITLSGELPESLMPVVIDNVVDTGNTAEACVKALGKGIVASLADSVEKRKHVASLKSAEPVVVDKNGNVVPLSKRFEIGGKYLEKAEAQPQLTEQEPATVVMEDEAAPITVNDADSLIQEVERRTKVAKDKKDADDIVKRYLEANPKDNEVEQVRKRATKAVLKAMDNAGVPYKVVSKEEEKQMLKLFSMMNQEAIKEFARRAHIRGLQPHGRMGKYIVYNMNDPFGVPVYFEKLSTAKYGLQGLKQMAPEGDWAILDIGWPDEIIGQDEAQRRAAEVNSLDDLELMMGWHGSGARFDAFDHRYMSSGEGNQSYGWGTYITEVEGIGRMYAEAMGSRHTPATYKGITSTSIALMSEEEYKKLGAANAQQREILAQIVGSCNFGYGDPVRMINVKRERLEEQLERKQDVVEDAKEQLEEGNLSEERLTRLNNRIRINKKIVKETQEALEFVNSLDPNDFKGWSKPNGSFLYKVDIPEDTGDNYFDWTKPLPEERADKILAEVRKRLLTDDKYGWKGKEEKLDKQLEAMKKFFGETFYWRVATLLGNSVAGAHRDGHRMTSELLSKHGYVGVKYPAEYRSGGRDDGAMNYVIFNEDDAKIKEVIQFMIGGDDAEAMPQRTGLPVFYSNAMRAVEGIKQEKATPEQWLKMIEKGGGLKAGEDKWLGLRAQLEDAANMGIKSVTKDAILNYIRDHQVQVEDVNYGKKDTPAYGNWNREGNGYRNAYDDKMFIEDVTNTAYYDGKKIDTFDNFDDAENALIAYTSSENPIHPTRLDYTTAGLKNKREIALVVPTIEPYAGSDQIHFGDAGGGRAVAWVRFGDTTTGARGQGAARTILDDIEKRIGTTTNYSKMSDEDAARRAFANYLWRDNPDAEWMRTSEIPGDVGAERAEHVVALFDKLIAGNADGKKVLVIDEIQSKRHQDARELGYQGEFTDSPKKQYEVAYDKLMEYKQELDEKYGEYHLLDQLTPEERAKYEEMYQKVVALSEVKDDKVYTVPDAPFEKNWHELAMKRMLRYAAENGYDKIAWTTGAQQAERYDLGGVIDKIETYPHSDPMTGEPIEGQYNVFIRQKDGNYIHQQGMDGVLTKEQILQNFGKDLGQRIMDAADAQPDGTAEISGEGLQVGGEGMRGFYDEILVRFMNKYGKKWGVKVEQTELPEIGQTMWTIDVTPEMKESVMQGQPMFHKQDKKILGWSDGKQVFLTQAGLNPNTPLHECTHLWDKWCQKEHPELWAKVVNALKKTEMWKQIAENPNYRNIWNDENRMASEVHSRLSGAAGEEEFMKAAFKKSTPKSIINEVKSALRKFWEAVLRLFNKHAKTLADDFESLASIVRMPIRDLVNEDFEKVMRAAGERTDAMLGYHGSSAIFDRFDLSKVGSGEGQAVSGHGTYITTSEGTARYYADVAQSRRRKVVQEMGYTIDGKVVKDPALVRAYEYLQRANGNVDEAIKACEHTIEVLNRHKDKNPFAALRGNGKSMAEEALDYLKKEQEKPGTIGFQEEIVEQPARQLYEVDIPDDTGKNYFDLDKTLTQKQKNDIKRRFLDALNNSEEADYWKKNRDIIDYDWKMVDAKDATGSTAVGVMEQFLPSKNVSEILSNMGYVGNKTKGSDGTTYVVYNEDDITIKNRVEFMMDDIDFHIEDDADTLDWLDNEPTELGYRNVAVNEDGTLGSPMANRLGKKGVGRKATTSFEYGKWERSDENPELADDNGKINLIKPNGKPVEGVDYNPYIHIRPNKVNKQFKEAWRRPELIYVETEYPKSELEGGYQAEKAAKPVGKHPWGGGELILSRWDKPVRMVPWEEVADDWEKEFAGRGVEFDIVPPALLPILAERGIEILPPHKGSGKECQAAYEKFMAEELPQLTGQGKQTEAIFNQAKKLFGTTYDIREAGYVLPDGTMPDISGRHLMDPGSDTSFLRGRRTTDHREVQSIAYERDGNTKTGIETDMPDFIRRGAIRIDNNGGAINLATKPTSKQKEILRKLIANNDGYVYVDFGDGWDSDHYVEYDGAKPARVLADIDRYFDEGIKPLGDEGLMRSKGKGKRNYPNVDSLQKAEEFISESLQGKHTNQRLEMVLPQATLRMIRAKFGRDYDSHNIYANGIVHSKKIHGENGEKISSNSIPLRDEDFKLAPYIMTAPDKVGRGSMGPDGRESIRFEKTLGNGYVVVVEKEQKNSPDDMDTITMWAELSSGGADARKNTSPVYTSQPANVVSKSNSSDANARTVISSIDAAKIRKDAELAIENDKKMRQVQQNRMKSAADATAEQLGGTSVKYASGDDITDEKLKRENENGTLGIYDPNTGEVTLFLDNIEDVEEAKRTVFHEKLGHEGLVALMGSQEEVNKFGTFIFKSAGKTLRQRIMEKADSEDPQWKDGSRFSKAAQEVFADIAADGPRTEEEFDLWTKVKHYIIRLCKKLGIRVKGLLNDKDLSYYILKTGEALKRWNKLSDEEKAAVSQQQTQHEILRSRGGKPRKRNNESMAQYFERLRAWEKWKVARQTARDNGDPEPEESTFHEQAEADFRADLKEWKERNGIGEGERFDATMPRRREGESPQEYAMRIAEYEAKSDLWKTAPSLMDYLSRANEDYRRAYVAWRERYDLQEEMSVDQRIYEGDVDPNPTFTDADMEAEALAEKDLAEAAGMEVDEAGAKRHAKLAIIERRKDMESANAEDAIWIYNFVKQSDEVAAQIAQRTGQKVTGKELREALPFLIEADRRRENMEAEREDAVMVINMSDAIQQARSFIDYSNLDEIGEELNELNEAWNDKTNNPNAIADVAYREAAARLAGKLNALNAGMAGYNDLYADDIMQIRELLNNAVKAGGGNAMPESAKRFDGMPEVQQLMSHIKDWFDEFFQVLEDAGLRGDAGYIEEGYVNHVWDKEKSDPKAWEKYVENRQRTKSPNMRHREIDTYMDGIEIGLVPKYTDIADMIAHYSRQNNEAVANRRFLDDLQFVVVEEMNSDGEVVAVLPLIEFDKPSGFVRERYVQYYVPGCGDVYVLKHIQKRFANIFGTMRTQDAADWLSKMAKGYDLASSTAKKIQLALSGFHALALFEVDVAQNNPAVAMKHLLKYIIADSIQSGTLPAYAHPEDFQLAAKHLVQLGATEDYAAADVNAITAKIREVFKGYYESDEAWKKAAGAAGSPVAIMMDWINKGFDTVLWNYLHDGLKLCAFKELVKQVDRRVEKEGLDAATREQLLDEAGQYVNDMFGGQYWELINVSPATLKWMRRAFLSPDWLLSTQRHFFANFGFGSVYSESGFRNYIKYNTDNIQRLLGKDIPHDELRRLRSSNAKYCYLIGAMIWWGLFYNAINALCRWKDEEDEKEKAEEERKTNPDYKSPYELAYPDGMKWYDYTMYGNTIGQQTHLFTGRYADGTETYVRWGKQFREFPELFIGRHGLEFPAPIIQRMMSKANPNIGTAIDFLGAQNIGGFNGSYENKELREKYGKTVATLAATARHFIPFGMPTQAEKEYKWLDFFMPSSKGFSRWKAKDYFETFILDGDWEGIEATYNACVMNGVDAEKNLDAAIASIKAAQKKELADGVTDLTSAAQKFDAATDPEQRKLFLGKLKKHLKGSEYKVFTRDEAMEKVQSFWDGGKPDEKENARYLMLATSEDIIAEEKLKDLGRQAKKYIKEIDNAPVNEQEALENRYAVWFDIDEIVKDANRDIREAKKGMGGMDDDQRMEDIRKAIRDAQQEIDKLEAPK